MNKQITADQNLVRRINSATVLDAIRLFAPLSRADLAVRTGLNRSTISSIVDELILSQYVHETTLKGDHIGRPGMMLELDPSGGAAVGVEIGVDFISVILSDFSAGVFWQKRIFHAENAPQTEVLAQAEGLINAGLQTAAQRNLRPLGIGLGVPGLVDAHQGKLVYAPNLGWADIPLRSLWTTRFNLPVYVENEANAAAMGEYFYGAAHGKNDFIYMSTGIGLGGGIMIDGKLFRGHTGYAGEIGHSALYLNGEPCGCGSEGCWETYVGPRSVLRRIRHTLQNGQSSILNDMTGGDLSRLSLEMAAEAARGNDSVALTALQEVGTHLGVGVSNLINIFNPELIIVGGALSLAMDTLFPIIQESIQKNALQPLVERVQVVPSHLGLDSCVYGAAALVLDEIVREPRLVILP